LSDKETLFGLQERYLQSRSGEDLEFLYRAVLSLSEKVSSSLITRYGIPISPEKRTDIEVDAATDLITHYLKDPDFRITVSFYSYIRRILQTAFYRPSRKKINLEGTIDLYELSEIQGDSDEEMIERLRIEHMVDQILQRLLWKLTREEIVEVFPHVIDIIERPGRKDYKTFLYRIRDDNTRALVDEVMQQIREEIRHHVQEQED